MKRLLILLPFISVSLGFSQNSQNMNLLSTWTSDSANSYNDIWGYTADGREYAIMGSNWGTHFIDVTDPNSPSEVESFIGNANNVTWRDFKTYSHYAYGVADGDSNSLQIFDLQNLPSSVTKVVDDVALSSSCHNIFIESDRLYLASNTSAANGATAMDIYSLTNPSTPTLALSMNSTFFGGERIHDVFVKDNIAYCSAGYGGLYIYDLNNLNHPVLLNSITTYPDQGYNHSSWLSDDNSILVVADEVPSGLALKLFDVSQMDDIEFLSTFESHGEATPHNPFIIGDKIYIGYYMDGIQVFDYSDVFNVSQFAYYDTYMDNTDYINFGPFEGCWGLYPFFQSQNLIGSDIKYGLNVARVINLGLASAVEENKKNTNLNLFPNPASSMITLQNIKNYESIRMTNMIGKVIYNYENVEAKNVHKIKTEDIPAGVYFVTLKDDNQDEVKKVVIK